MSHSDKNLGKHLAPPLDEARLARQYARVVEATNGRRIDRSWFRFALPALALALAAVVWLVVGRSPAPTAVVDGMVLEVGSTAAEAITMRDGTRVVLAENTKLTLTEAHADRVRLDLARGAVDLDVTHVPGRSFVVVASHHTVTVVGTHFEVRYLEEVPRRLEVRVDRGRVKVERDGSSEVRFVSAGEKWSTEIEPAEMPASSAHATLPPDVPPSSAEASAAVAAETAAPPSASVLRASPKPHVDGVAPSSPLPTESAKDLLLRAQAARAAGNPREAAALLDTLRRQHRTDARAGLAAFELGRVRLDALKDPAGAVEAFDDAIVLAPNAPFREDAEARRVQALDTVGNATRCNEAKQTYLDRYPQGLHRAEVRRHCGGS